MHIALPSIMHLAFELAIFMGALRALWELCELASFIGVNIQTFSSLETTVTIQTTWVALIITISRKRMNEASIGTSEYKEGEWRYKWNTNSREKLMASSKI